jgi:ABC-type cobalamin/Fe3+-siderophores transport system ATPase subunit
MFFYFNNIPNDLLKRSTTDEDINVIIGENGSGKSSLLSEVANWKSR